MAPNIILWPPVMLPNHGKARVVLVGASHMVRLAKKMGTNTISLAFPGFRPKEPNISEIAEELQKLNLSSRDTVVLDLLSNSAFMGTDSNGLPTETVKMTDGGYHVIGSLTVAPILCVKKTLAACVPAAGALRKTGVVLLSPVPRYMHVKCCDDQTHVENFDDPELDEEIGDSLEAYKRALQNWGMENELLFMVIDPTILTDSCDCPIKSRVTEDGVSIWSRRDPGAHDQCRLLQPGYSDQRHCAIGGSDGLGECDRIRIRTQKEKGGVCCNNATTTATECETPPGRGKAEGGRLATW
jgi:hypothetical protein